MAFSGNPTRGVEDEFAGLVNLLAADPVGARSSRSYTKNIPSTPGEGRDCRTHARLVLLRWRGRASDKR
jgi:hypothetical protein